MNIKKYRDLSPVRIASAVLCFLLIFLLLFAVSDYTRVVALADDSELLSVNIIGSFDTSPCRQMLANINDLRANDAWYWNETDTEKVQLSGLQPLVYDYELERVAMQRAADLAAYYAHTRPDGTDCWTAYPDTFNFTARGENIAYGFTTGDSVFVAWAEADKDYAGQGHRRNMLNSSFRAVGIGCFRCGNILFWAQEFSSKVTGSAPNPLTSPVGIEITRDRVEGAGFNTSRITLMQGQSISLAGTGASIIDAYSPGIKVPCSLPDSAFQVANTSCARISGGKLIAVNPGETTLTVTIAGMTASVPITVKPDTTISVNAPQPVAIQAGETVYFRFVPSATGTYTFSSTGIYDTYGYVYDSDLIMLDSDDDSGENYNFSIQRQLTAGTQYYFGVRFWSPDEAATVTVALTADFMPMISAHPSAVTAAPGSTATFRVTASGSGLSYQWEYQRPGESTWNTVLENGKAATFNQPGVAARHNGFLFRCKVSNSSGSVYSNAAMLTVSSVAPTITAHPISVTTSLGSTATFRVAAAGVGLSYQWQYLLPGENIWTDVVVNGQTVSFSQTNVESRHNGFLFRCKVSNSYGTAYSGTAKLTAPSSAPSITAQPKSISAALGTTATFRVTATGSNLSYQWQYQRPGESTWNTVLENGRAATFNQTNVEERHNGFLFRCLVSNSYGSVLTTPAKLTAYSSAPTITAQPSSVTAQLGTTATFRVTATGSNLSYQWQYQRPGESSWNTVLDNGKAATFNQTNVEARHNGFKFRCLVSNSAGSVYSNAATLSVPVTAPTIITQPSSVTAQLGTTATFRVTATGSNLSYQWQYQRPNESTWNTVLDNGKAATFNQTNVEVRHNGFKFRCLVSNSAGSVYSNAATLSVNTVSVPTIITQPNSVTASPGTTAAFQVTAAGSGLSYQWQYQRPGESTWNTVLDNGKSSTFNQTNVEARHNGFKFRCLVSNSAGSAYSNAATLTVSSAAPVITAQPSPVSAALGSTATFRVTAVGSGLSYQWQYQRPGESTWTDVIVNGKDATFNQTGVQTRHNGFLFRCKVSNGYGTVYSNSALLSVK